MSAEAFIAPQSGAADGGEATCRAPSQACIVDLVHLSCITMGDKALERDVLAAYAAQLPIHRRALLAGPGQGARRAAHMLVGSSKAVGARRVAALAEAVQAGDAGASKPLLAALDDTMAFIADLRN